MAKKKSKAKAKTKAKNKKKKSAKVEYPKPSVTADVVIVWQEQVLLIKRKNDPFADHFALPGGFVDPHEEPLAAAMREAREETNLDVENLQLINVYGKKDRDPRGWTISVAYLYQTEQEPKPEAKDDAQEVAWIKLGERESIELAFDHRDILNDAVNLLQAMKSAN